MADTKTNGNRPVSTPVTPGGNGGVAGATPILGADSGLSQIKVALQAVLEPKLSAQVRKHTVKLKSKLVGLIGQWLEEAVTNPGLAPGRDPQALLDEWNLVEGLKSLVPTLSGLTRQVEDTILVRQAEVWTAVLAIYGVAGHVPNDPKLAALVKQTAAALSPGPRKQTVTHTALKAPIPHGKDALHALALAHASAAPEPAGPGSASGAPATNSNSGTPSSGTKS